jgi:hypothetical protein
MKTPEPVIEAELKMNMSYRSLGSRGPEVSVLGPAVAGSRYPAAQLAHLDSESGALHG